MRSFTRSVRKILLIKDHPHLGFKGEICFVKPGYAFNNLVPNGYALMYTDRRVKEFEADAGELTQKQ